jgi:hypothetical protein
LTVLIVSILITCAAQRNLCYFINKTLHYVVNYLGRSKFLCHWVYMPRRQHSLVTGHKIY